MDDTITIPRRLRPPGGFLGRFDPAAPYAGQDDPPVRAVDPSEAGTLRPVDGLVAEWDRVVLFVAAGTQLGDPRHLVIGREPDGAPGAAPEWIHAWRFDDPQARMGEHLQAAYAAWIATYGQVAAHVTLREPDGTLEAELLCARRTRPGVVTAHQWALVQCWAAPGPGELVEHVPSYDEVMEAWCGTAEQWAVEELDPSRDPLAVLLAARLRMTVAAARMSWAAGVAGAELRALDALAGLAGLGGWDREQLAGLLDVSRVQLHKVLSGKAWLLPPGVE